MKDDVLILHDSLDGGGAEKALIEILNHFDYRHYNVTLILYLKRGIYLDFIPETVRVLSIYPHGHKLLYERLINVTPWIRRYERHKLLALIGNKHFCSIISFMEGPPASLHSHILDRSHNNISWVHTNMALNPWGEKFFDNRDCEQQFYASVDHLVFVSTDIQACFPYHTSAVTHHIPNIVEPDKIRQQALQSPLPCHQEFTIAYVGRFVALKRPDRFVKTVALLKQRGCRIRGEMIGCGEMENEVSRLAHELGVAEEIDFVGFKSNPYPYINRASLLVIPSDTEGLSIVMLEAFCLGIPVISTRCTGPSQYLHHGGGILTDFNEASMADAIEMVYNNPVLLKRLQQEALDYSRLLSPDSVMRDILDIIQSK